jgi:hypothetical protein
MSRGMQPKNGDEPIRLGFNGGLYTLKEKRSHPDDRAESSMNTLSVNIRKRGSMLKTAACTPNLRADTWVRPYRRLVTCMIAVWY